MLKFQWAIVYMQVNIESRARARGGRGRQIGSQDSDRGGRQRDGSCGGEPGEVTGTMRGRRVWASEITRRRQARASRDVTDLCEINRHTWTCVPAINPNQTSSQAFTVEQWNLCSECVPLIPLCYLQNIAFKSRIFCNPFSPPCFPFDISAYTITLPW